MDKPVRYLIIGIVIIILGLCITWFVHISGIILAFAGLSVMVRAIVLINK